MEELQITITVLCDKAQNIENNICELLNYGNVPEENFNKAHELLTKWKQLKHTISEMEDVEHAIRHNHDVGMNKIEGDFSMLESKLNELKPKKDGHR